MAFDLDFPLQLRIKIYDDMVVNFMALILMTREWAISEKAVRIHNPMQKKC